LKENVTTRRMRERVGTTAILGEEGNLKQERKNVHMAVTQQN
jgi:hypothetical protein